MSTEAEQDEAERDEARVEVESLRDLPGRLHLPTEAEWEHAEEQARLLLGIRLDRYKTIADAWRTKVAEVERERDEARDEHDRVVEERERAHRACNAYWHDLERIASLCERTADEYPLKAVERTVRERDEARAEVERLRALLARAYGYSTGAGDE